MKIKDIMITDVIYVSPEAPISKVADILFTNRFHGLPVVEKEKLVGIITEDDFFLKDYDKMYLPSYIQFIKENKIINNLPDETKDKIERLLSFRAKDIMSTNCLVANPEMETEDLMKTIRETKFTTFPVTDKDNSLKGIVTLSDILGTVRHGSAEMRKAFGGKFKNKETEKIIKELNSLWKEQLVIISKRRVRTWKGIVFISTISAIGLAILAYAAIISKKSCDIEQKAIYPIECQRFNYSDWSACQADGTQTRKVLGKLPDGCAGGAPEVVRPCQ